MRYRNVFDPADEPVGISYAQSNSTKDKGRGKIVKNSLLASLVLFGALTLKDAAIATHRFTDSSFGSQHSTPISDSYVKSRNSGNSCPTPERKKEIMDGWLLAPIVQPAEPVIFNSNLDTLRSNLPIHAIYSAFAGLGTFAGLTYRERKRNSNQ